MRTSARFDPTGARQAFLLHGNMGYQPSSELSTGPALRGAASVSWYVSFKYRWRTPIPSCPINRDKV